MDALSGLGCADPPLPPASGSSPAAPAATVPPAAPAAAALASASAAAAPPAAASAATVGSSFAAPASHPHGTVAPAPRRYHTRVSPTPPSPPHPWPSQRAPPSKRVWTSSLGESSSSKPQDPHFLPHLGLAGAPPLDLSPASIIRRPLFHYNLIPGNADCNERDLDDEVYYDLSSFSADLEFRDSMLLVKRYSLEPFMTPRRFFYPRVVIEFYHTMTSRSESHPTALHFSIDGRPGILWALDIVATFNLPLVLANSIAYR